MEQRPQKATGKTAKILIKTGTNLNKILDIHVIEDFIKALQCATLILCSLVMRNAMEQRPQYKAPNKRFRPINRPKSGIFWAKTQKIPLYQIWAKLGPKMATPPL